MIYNMTWHDYYINKQRNGKILIYNRVSVSPYMHTYMICNIWYDIMMYPYAREWCTIYVTWCDMIDVSIQKGTVKKMDITNLKKALLDSLWRCTLFLISSHLAS